MEILTRLLNLTDKLTTLNEENRSIEVIAATDNPVDIYDSEYGRILEKLDMAAVNLSEKQLPLLNSHNRNDIKSIVGSVRELRVENNKLIGRAYFSDTAKEEFTKLKEGHLNSFSIGYRVDREKTEYRPDENLIIRKNWQPMELSIVAIPADPNAKARADRVSNIDNNNKQELNKMSDKQEAVIQPVPESKKAEIVLERSVKDELASRETLILNERKRVSEITAVCRKFEMPEEFERKAIDAGQTIEDVNKQILEKLVKDRQNQVFVKSQIEIGVDEKEKFRSASTDGMLMRAGIKVEKPSDGALDLRGFSLLELARRSLILNGQKDRGNVLDVVGRAMTTSDFPYILANVANKALFTGFDTTPETWRIWCSTGSVSDFKTHYLVRASETDDLDEIPEGTEYQYGSRTEAQETYSIATYGKMFAITRQTIINDDLRALTNIPMMHGEAAARKIGDIAYTVLSANANMGDGNPLFDDTNHANIATGGNKGNPGILTIGEAIRAMKMQKDEKGLRNLNIQPRYFIAGPSLEGISEIFFRSERFSDNATIATDSTFASTRVNPYSGSYFTRVYDARIDDYPDTSWYIAGDNNKTVTVFFLNGQQSPYLEMQNGWTVDGVEYKVRIDCGAKAVSWKALYQNPIS